MIAEPSFQQFPYGQRVVSLLEGACDEVFIFSDFHQNAVERDVYHAADVAKSNRVQLIIALGGRACIEVARAASVLCCHLGKFKDYALDGQGRSSKKITRNALPTLAIPST